MKASEQNRRRREVKTAPRGDIRDRNGVLLAGTRPEFVVSINHEQFNVNGPEGRRLAECLGISLAELKDRAKPVGPEYKRVRVAVDVPWTVLAKLEEKRPWLPGVSTDLEELRLYPQGKLAGHVLGYIGPISQKQLEEHKDIYSPDSRVGVTGLERVYESQLRGLDGGLIIEVDASGRRTRLLSEDPPQRGADYTLTIDASVQKAAEDGLKGRVGSAVAIDPRTGEVLALASRPGYDPNLFARGIGVSQWRAILNDKNLPLMNRAVQSAYPPASTFKLITSLAGFKAGIINRSSGVQCTGAVYLGKHRFKCWKRHGYVDYAQAVAQSCDIFFYRVGRAVGPDHMSDMAKSFGLGSRSGIDTTGEARGTVPSIDWKKRNIRRDPTWHPGETLNMSIGQGYLQATSLQIALMAGGVAMHGKIFQPHLVKNVRSRGKTIVMPSKVIHSNSLPSEYYDHVLTGMRQAVETGTCRAAALPGILVGGKTGSAETTGKAHAWFVGLAPLGNPRIAVCVMVEHGAHGATAAAPVARAMMAAFFKVNAGGVLHAVGD